MKPGEISHPHAHDRSPAGFLLRYVSDFVGPLSEGDLRHRIPRGRALDVAMGEGRHALYLAAQGFRVTGIDRDAAAVARARAKAGDRGLSIDARVADLEREGRDLVEPGAFSLVVNFHYLQRDLIPRLRAALAPGGWILFETFTSDHPRVSRTGRPSNPDFLLRRGELRTCFEDLSVVEYEEGVFPTRDGDRQAVARLAAFKP